MEEKQREHNKIILQTSFTSLETIYYLLATVKKNQPVSSEDGRSKVFPIARARIAQDRGGEWSADKRDTHAELTLREMRFIRDGKSKDTFEVSDLGERFLASFQLIETPAENGKVKIALVDLLSSAERNQLLLDILTQIYVTNKKYGRNIRPYLILFKLLTVPALGGYITRSEWASIINSSKYIVDSQFEDIQKEVVEVRASGKKVEPQKSDRILTRLVLWGVLSRIQKAQHNEPCFEFNADFAQTVNLNMLKGLAISTGEVTEIEDCIVEENEFDLLSPEWFMEKADNYQNIDSEAAQLYSDFYAKFSPEQISKLTGNDILQTLFYSGDSNKENLCYILEKHPRYKDLFGSIDGGSAYKFMLFFHSEKQSWVTGTGQKSVNLSVSEAIALGQEIRDALVKGASIIENNTNLNSLEDYLALYNQLLGCIPKYIKYQWVLKYYHMLFPHLFPVFYSLDWQQHVLHNLNIVPNDETFIRMGQIALFVRQCNISQAVFSKIIHDYVGEIKSFLRIGTGDHGELFNEWKANNYVAVGWNFLGSLDSYCIDSKKKELQKDVIIEQLLTNCPSYDKKTASRKYGEISNFYAAVKENTYFVAMDGQKILGIALLKGDYKFDETKTYAHYREVEWIKLTNNNAKLPVNEALRTTCVEIEESENIIFLYSLIRELKILDDEVETAAKDQETREIKMIDREPRKNKIHPLNQILYGAPGTGKTYATAEYALAVIENRAVNETQKTESERKALMQEYKNYISTGQIVFTTFHQSYGYEDFIQGLRPDTSSGEMKFHVVDGVFKTIAQRAMLNPDKNYVIIIDEINRANISKVFGELITLIEEDKRWGELNAVSVTLPSGEPFAVPNNLYIIGTMNSADKSISLIDTALRRRFSFIEKAPRADMISDGKMRAVLETLNGYIKQELKSTDLLIGHAFFIGKNENELSDLMNENIIPLLYEYFYDDENKVKKALDCLKDTKYEIDKVHIGRIRVKAKE